MEIKYPKHLDTDEFRLLFEEFINHRKKLKKPLTNFAIALTLKKIAPFPLDECIQAIENTILNGWLGIFPKKKESDDYFEDLERGL
jgi:hypothetical protein